MRLLKYVTKRMITNPYLLFWGVGFLIFWEIIGAFVESSSIPKVVYAEEYYTASWYGIIITLSSSALGVSINYVLSYQTGGLPHLFRYSRLTPKYYLSSTYIGMGVVNLILSIVMLATTYLLFGIKFGFSEAIPKNFPLLLITALIAGLFYTALSFNLSMLTLKTSRKMENLIDFIPLVLGYLFGFSYLYANAGYVFAFSPFSEVAMLGISGFTGSNPPIYTIQQTNPQQTITFVYPLLGLILWTLALSGVAVFNLRKLYYKPLEEGKTI
ncbi:hypothetical protein BFU36_12030 [Sulfolobus sp. A20]|uniref:hypothetical protein n=1 Tax=Saccharolobus sp. A20 TaxID=1891280 RepID=UPI000845CCC3|nr:hypothetical protein [Sulfolobus sp. A20]AOL17317.1 hypothetical protein BFU36_12030 [Sulfolobus sp. A20]TRM74445.1 hypothetical protein DJ532_12860 [Sulfolobus sp. A20-N-F8]TRM80808.1 hypothetical protein DJ531_11790 [Sulfolobus sp. A20-N-F6]TRM99020.1 hypothetical protein DJ527_09380 [Sulfolobus sp. F1]